MTLLAADSHLQPNVTLIIVVSVLVAAGVYLVLERSLTRVLLGIVLMSNGVAGLYLVVMGRARGAPLLGERPPEEMSDPLPEAFVLTAIVISLATVAFVMAMAYRYWRLTGSDDVPDDLEDALVQRLAERDQPSESYDADVSSTTEAEEDPDEAEAREAEEKERAAQAAAGGDRADSATGGGDRGASVARENALKHPDDDTDAADVRDQARKEAVGDEGPGPEGDRGRDGGWSARSNQTDESSQTDESKPTGESDQTDESKPTDESDQTDGQGGGDRR